MRGVATCSETWKGNGGGRVGCETAEATKGVGATDPAEVARRGADRERKKE